MVDLDFRSRTWKVADSKDNETKSSALEKSHSKTLLKDVYSMEKVLSHYLNGASGGHYQNFFIIERL